MHNLKFQFAKLLNTMGLSRYANNIWNRAEAEVKQKKWGSSNFQNTFLIEEGLLFSKLEPKRKLLETLAESQIYSQASNFFDVFGFASLRGYFNEYKIKNLETTLGHLQNSFSTNKTIHYNPIEKNQALQDLLLDEKFFYVISKIIGPFWYSGSDAAVQSKTFPLHRDTFFNPPVIKILIPTQPGIFQILCGSHHANDEFSRNVGSCVCDWDRPNNRQHSSSSVFFTDSDSGPKVVGYDDSHQNPPITNIPLNPGDVFIFNQCLVHGLRPLNSTVSFVAFSVFPSPENSRKYKMSRVEHLNNIIKSSAIMMLAEIKLSSFKHIDTKEIVYPSMTFSEQDLSRLTQARRLKDYFGLFEINEKTWQKEIMKNSDSTFQRLKDNL